MGPARWFGYCRGRREACSNVVRTEFCGSRRLAGSTIWLSGTITLGDPNVASCCDRLRFGTTVPRGELIILFAPTAGAIAGIVALAAGTVPTTPRTVMHMTSQSGTK